MDRPNILYIMADDHTSQAWGCYGSRLTPYISTPNIDRLAAEGARLANCFCTNSICTPSRATILTGQYSHRNGVRTLADGLDPAADNVAKQLQAGGYATAIFGKWHLKNQPAGFDHYNVLHGQGRYHNPLLWRSDQPWESEGVEHEGHSTDVITDLTLDWLQGRAEAEAPFFCMCHFKATHGPFWSHDRYRDLYAEVEFPEPEDLLWDQSPRGKVFAGWPLEIHAERCRRQPDRNPPPPLETEGLDEAQARKATYQKMLHDYMRTVAGIDDNIGRLLAYLDESGLAENTVVVYTSDQGYFLGEHNLFDKRFMLEESLRMPFVVRYPAEIAAGSVLEDIVTNVDFPELFLDYAGLPVPPGMQGRSFRDNLRGRTPADWPEAMYYHYWTPHQPERPSHYGLRTRTRKLIRYYGLERDEGRPAEACWELYDLEADPGELENRIADPAYAAELPPLREALETVRRGCGDTEDFLTFYPPLAEVAKERDRRA
jgi:arylsulfatase A-like enzyme